jgi:hypothetical protein
VKATGYRLGDDQSAAEQLVTEAVVGQLIELLGGDGILSRSCRHRSE